MFKAELSGKRSDIEDACLARLKRGAAGSDEADDPGRLRLRDEKLFCFLKELGFGYVIRFRGEIFVSAADGETRRAEDWVGAGPAHKLANAEISKEQQKMGAVVCVHVKGTKDAWHLTASDAKAMPRAIMDLYCRRWC